MAKIVQHHAEAGLANATGQLFQRRFLLRADVTEKRQCQMQISCGDRPPGFGREGFGAPADHLLL
ncbi:hypothetical protein D3C79_580550 [compost metagenome]